MSIKIDLQGKSIEEFRKYYCKGNKDLITNLDLPTERVKTKITIEDFCNNRQLIYEMFTWDLANICYQNIPSTIVNLGFNKNDWINTMNKDTVIYIYTDH